MTLELKIALALQQHGIWMQISDMNRNQNAGDSCNGDDTTTTTSLDDIENTTAVVSRGDLVDNDLVEEDVDTIVVVCKWNVASGMLQLLQEQSTVDPSLQRLKLPRWIPLVEEQEAVLIADGLSFLDLDESEPLPSFDIMPPIKKEPVPQWKNSFDKNNNDNKTKSMDSIPSEDALGWHLSSLGFSLNPSTPSTIERLASGRLQTDLARLVLLEGATDPRGFKRTHNGYDFSGSFRKRRIRL